METEKNINSSEAEIAPKFSSVLDLERLGKNYENTNGSLADHMLSDIKRNLEKHEEKLTQQAKIVLSKAQELDKLLQDRFDVLENVLDRQKASLGFYKEKAREIVQLHMATRELFGSDKVTE